MPAPSSTAPASPSPAFARAWLIRALLPAILLLLFHLLGWREMVTILSGTVPEGYSPQGAMIRAAAYMLAWFGTVILTPILTIATFLRWIIERRRAPAAS